MPPALMFLTPSRPEFCRDTVSTRLNDGRPAGQIVEGRDGEVITYLALDNGALLKELGDYLVVLGSAELGFELALGSAVEHALVALPAMGSVSHAVTLPGLRFIVHWSVRKSSLLVRDEDLEAADDLGEGHALVLLPVVDGLDAVGEDDKVVLVALVVDLDLGSVSAHVDGVLMGVGK